MTRQESRPDNDVPTGEGAQESSESAAPTTGHELRAKDEELIKVISERKRTLSERGIKLTVVLLTTRAMLGEGWLRHRDASHYSCLSSL